MARRARGRVGLLAAGGLCLRVERRPGLRLKTSARGGRPDHCECHDTPANDPRRHALMIPAAGAPAAGPPGVAYSQASVMQIDSSVRPAGGTGRPFAAINVRRSWPASGCEIADWTPTRTSPSA